MIKNLKARVRSLKSKIKGLKKGQSSSGKLFIEKKFTKIIAKPNQEER